jgi:hypothetical protein
MTKNNAANFVIVLITAIMLPLLVVTGSIFSSLSYLTNQAYAGGHKRTSYHQTAAQSCVNQNARCQDLLDQIQGHDNAATVFGNQP